MITARGGSKGIPGKNLKLLAGKPLLAYTIAAARECSSFDRVIVSTDDRDIADYAKTVGCDVPFLRPAELAHDETPHLPVLQHAVQWLAQHQSYRPDAVVILQPTSPLRRAAHIREAVVLLASNDVDSVVSVSRVPTHLNPMRMLRVDATGRAVLFVSGEPVRRRINRRQDMPEAWVMNGAVYAFRTRVLDAQDPSLYGDTTLAMPMSDPFGISIDTPDDWLDAEKAIENAYGS